jgi:FkbM family methyltransferase
MLRFNRRIKRVWIDVGSDWTSFSSRSHEVWPTLYWKHGRSTSEEYVKSSDLGVIALDANSGYISQLKRMRRLIPIHAAVTENDGQVRFHHYAAPGASSVLVPGVEAKGSPGIPDECVELIRSELVPSIRLESIISALPASIEIELLKVDTQGNDLKVVKSAGEQIKRVKMVLMEIQDTRDGRAPFYEGQDTFEEAMDWMTKMDFVLNKKLSWFENPEANEWNLVFNNLKFHK